jgi:serine/threonine protein kinase
MPLGPGVRLGAYEILGLIGAGGMGQVYKARDVRLDRFVAVKILSAEFATDSDRRRALTVKPTLLRH